MSETITVDEFDELLSEFAIEAHTYWHDCGGDVEARYPVINAFSDLIEKYANQCADCITRAPYAKVDAQAERIAELLEALRVEGRMAVHWQCKHERDVADLNKQIKDLEAEVAPLREHLAEWQRFNSAMTRVWNDDDTDYDKEAHDDEPTP